MAGDILAKEVAIITLTSAGVSLTNGSGGAAGTDLDVRAAGNAADCFEAMFELQCQFGTVTGIVGGSVIADLYLVPKLDGANLADVDTTAGSSRMPAGSYFDSLICAKAPVAATNMRFVSRVDRLFPGLYTVHIINRAGQTMTVNWTLKVVPAKAQYT